MYRIKALNEDSDVEDEDDTRVTKEAEETIVMSEYMRAMKLQKDHFVDDALSLFSQLLTTQVLHEVSKTHTSTTLKSIKYNCYKNIGLIHKDKNNNDKALEFLIEAVEFDDSDVFTLNKLGQIALDMKQLDVSQIAFEKCLKQNANYWPAGDGILQILCIREDYNEAYGWALMWYEKNPKYQRGLDVILELREKFSGSFDYFENSWSIKFRDTHLKRANFSSVFPEPSFCEFVDKPKPNIDQFKIDSFEKENWLTLGKLITNLYEYLDGIENSPVNYKFTYTDFLRNITVYPQIEPSAEDEEMPLAEDINAITEEVTQSLTNDDDIQMEAKQDNGSTDGMKCTNSNPATEAVNSGEGSNEDSDAPANTGDEEQKNATKPKQSRRRGSDLKSLQPWCYWDRNRKYSQRQKNKQLERMENDTTINGFLRKILKKYFQSNFDDESPFHPGVKYSELSDTKPSDSEQKVECVVNDSTDNFQEATSDLFTTFVDGIKAMPIDAIDLAKNWTQCISKCWNHKMPDEMIEIYMKLYCFYTKHYDLAAWNHIKTADFHDAFRMTIFYLELKHADVLKTAKLDAKNEVSDEWILIFHPFVFYSGIYELSDCENEAIQHQLRAMWLLYCFARYEYDLNRSVDCLANVKELIQSTDSSLRLYLPNISHHPTIDLATIDELTTNLERTISLNNVRQLYLNKKYDELLFVLKDSLAITTKAKSATHAAMKVSTQFEIILECFWKCEMFDECFVWSERCLRYALDSFTATKKDKPSYLEWANNVNFILTYIEAIILERSYSVLKSLKTYCGRLVQSLVQIVTLQLDAPQERNVNHLHPIDLTKPWTILHHIVQREDDMKSYQSKNRPALERKESTDSSGTNGATEDEVEEEDTIPNSVTILFTAHEYLGGRMWCTKDNGKLLLFALELIVPLLRTPYLEAYRDIIAEYLEQITYCLYGYPAKRARLKHIEEHDAQNVDLQWKHALLLYDLYRPDDLPEFDSYKNDSITTEMEQLLQKIIALIPEDVDPSKHANEMEKFISGDSTELPEALDILPNRINTIYYLLADHYFKNRDFSKTIKFYTYDLGNCPTRFDAWAGLALSKASMMETKLNSCTSIPTKEWLRQSEEVLRCFHQCLKIGGQTVLLWIEYGSYAYALHSYCSRCLKQSSETLSMEKFEALESKKNDSLNVAQLCFRTIDTLTPIDETDKSKKSEDDEKWLYHYMLGKVAEKQKDPPNVVIEHYLKSAQYLYEHNATYPFKINSSSPQNLALEALEVFYRVTAVIIKYLEQHSVVTTAMGRTFIKILKQQAKSPFAMSKAKINENSVNAFKRKISMAHEEAAKQKIAKIDTSISSKIDPSKNRKNSTSVERKLSTDVNSPSTQENIENTEHNVVANAPKIEFGDSGAMDKSGNNNTTAEPMDVQESLEIPTDQKHGEIIDLVSEKVVITESTPHQIPADKCDPIAAASIPSESARRFSTEKAYGTKNTTQFEFAPNPVIANIIEDEIGKSPTRRGSQESTATTTTTTTTTSSDSTSSSSESTSTDSSSSDSDDTSSSDDDLNKDPDSPLDAKHVEMIYEMCMKNLEECVTRFPEHYKSIYRLVQVYLNGPDSIKNLDKCNQLLLGTYTTALGNQIQGLFTDRKSNNLFNGIWRNPSSEIDRPGSFSSHLSKCVNILMQIVRKNLDYKLLLEIISHLQRVPDADKRYIKESERKELLENAMAFCNQSFKDLIRKHSVEKPDDTQMLILIVEVFKAHKKCLKSASQKDSPYASILVEAYKAYIHGKIDWLPENANFLELATKLSNIEINAKKNAEKQLPQQPQQPSVGVRHMLEERGYNSLALSVSKYTPPNPVSGPVTLVGPVTNTQIPSVPIKPAIVQAPVISLLPAAAPATITPMPTHGVSITMVPQPPAIAQPVAVSAASGSSRPRGRPPGSKNINTKANISNMPAIPNIATTLLSPMAHMSAHLPDLNQITAHVDPSLRPQILGLLATPTFMQTLGQFSEPTSMTTFLKEYLRLSNYQQIPQLVSSFMDVLSRLATAINVSNSIGANPMHGKPQKTTKKQATVPKQPAMSITTVPSKQPPPAHSAQKPNLGQSLPPNTAITPVSHSVQSFMPPSASTVISVGSGQLTITPSISITPNPQPILSNLPQLPLPNFNMGIPAIPPKQPKQPKEKKPNPPKVYPDLGMNIPRDLPKSLSIIPSSTSMTPMGMPSMNIEILPKPKKAPASKAKQNLQAAQSTPPQQPTKSTILQSHSYLKASPSNQSAHSQLMMVDQLQQLLKTNDANFMSQFEQFLSTPPTQQATSKAIKPILPLNAPDTQSKGTIKVKQMDQLTNKPKANPKPKATSVKAIPPPQAFTNASIIGKGQAMSGTSNLLNAYGLPNVMQSMPSTSYPSKSNLPSNMATLHAINIPANLAANQISPTKSLQQKLAERQRQFVDGAPQSRPSSTSSATSVNTRKSDNDVIILD